MSRKFAFVVHEVQSLPYLDFTFNVIVDKLCRRYHLAQGMTSDQQTGEVLMELCELFGGKLESKHEYLYIQAEKTFAEIKADSDGKLCTDSIDTLYDLTCNHVRFL